MTYQVPHALSVCILRQLMVYAYTDSVPPLGWVTLGDVSNVKRLTTCLAMFGTYCDVV